jgi:hypothetical protein
MTATEAVHLTSLEKTLRKRRKSISHGDEREDRASEIVRSLQQRVEYTMQRTVTAERQACGSANTRRMRRSDVIRELGQRKEHSLSKKKNLMRNRNWLEGKKGPHTC